MTRKHYRILAQWLHDHRPDSDEIPQRILWEDMVLDLSHTLKMHNANFKADLFKAACGMTQPLQTRRRG